MGIGSELTARDGRLALALADGFAVCRDERELREQIAELPERIGADSVLVSGLSVTSGLTVLEPNDATLYRREMLQAVDRHLARLAGGRTNDGIAFDLGISRHTVVRHVARIYRKLGIHSRAAATRAALEALQEQ